MYTHTHGVTVGKNYNLCLSVCTQQRFGMSAQLIDPHTELRETTHLGS